jgi:hypothetical protein
MSNQFVVIFDNGGGTTIQTRSYCHHYDHPRDAATDVKALLRNDNPRRWDCNEPLSRMQYDADMDRNGGYKWHNRADIKAAIKTGQVDWLGWRNIQEFYQALGLILPE